MVRFIIFIKAYENNAKTRFTFHYGQIYYEKVKIKKLMQKSIYIPLWLDLLFWIGKNFGIMRSYLHSTMVRFIIF